MVTFKLYFYRESNFMPKNPKQTSKKTASIASKILAKPTGKKTKTIAASALTQAPYKSKVKARGK